MKKITTPKIIPAIVISALAMCNSIAIQPVHAANKLSAKEIRKYTQILENKEYIADSDQLIYDDADFMLYDLNNDGRKDLIISGPLGLRSVYGTIVYSYDGKKFHRSTKRGSVTGISKKGIELNDRDYEGTGKIYYESVVIYQLSTDGKLTAKAMSDSVGNIKEPTETEKYYKYNTSNKKIQISASGYQKLRKKYNLTEVSSDDLHEVNSSNIKTYISEFE